MGTAAVQGDLWSERAREWADLQEGMFAPLYDAAFDAAGLCNGKRLLDVGCGAGLALRMARERGAEVCGLDAAPGLVAIASARVPGADIRVGDIEELPFSEEAFDIVSGFNSFQYAADRVRALAEAGRVATRDGAVIVAVWGDPERCDFGGYLGALGRLLPPPPAGAPGPWALSPDRALESLIEDAGLEPGRSGRLPVHLSFADQSSAVRGLLAAGPAVRAIRHAGEEAVRDAVRQAIAAYRQQDGSYAFSNEFRYVVAHR